MKIVRAFKNDPHPSIIPFHSFIITPSYALITMYISAPVTITSMLILFSRAFLPTLVPVEVDESKSKEWFRSLLSGVEFLHKRGVVHNDIKFVYLIDLSLLTRVYLTFLTDQLTFCFLITTSLYLSTLASLRSTISSRVEHFIVIYLTGPPR
jgi:serine/threonine protein kinase